MYKIKREFNNGLFDCLEIYHDSNKILEITNNTLWNATEESPICIAKSRENKYILSMKPSKKTIFYLFYDKNAFKMRKIKVLIFGITKNRTLSTN